MRSLHCPCGTTIDATDDDQLVERTETHLAGAHPGRTYSRLEILFLAHST
ncbi:DUF1059 domain-containing protein [Rhodococcus sp. BP-349]|nr:MULTISPECIES: DUF1059 domain-containing protein [unclassified Rhodococcus (in: high G+C Gram-positive bacteria)]MBY6537776.1 DUF1059 domain-containing protein [Rhodococcus sp. BP-363]MBY6542113.1 DUF1059 domain-containing protein [Rhodococcus sp. BP-369]MBY6561343.1 DUF1059 domain-containing protein [Rhodococcus sp. BP-370]MBY6575635.1 DUF1059 domain-containing protein [Rhodococcus sp. BP-364]MBY6584936.1 DUF1059 domain-containing protein [Rhodococcus sp. BP-358]